MVVNVFFVLFVHQNYPSGFSCIFSLFSRFIIIIIFIILQQQQQNYITPLILFVFMYVRSFGRACTTNNNHYMMMIRQYNSLIYMYISNFNIFPSFIFVLLIYYCYPHTQTQKITKKQRIIYQNNVIIQHKLLQYTMLSILFFGAYKYFRGHK